MKESRVSYLKNFADKNVGGKVREKTQFCIFTNPKKLFHLGITNKNSFSIFIYERTKNFLFSEL